LFVARLDPDAGADGEVVGSAGRPEQFG